MTKPLVYVQPAVHVEAMRFMADNLVMTDVARWCGGKVGSEAKPSDHTDVAYWIRVPDLDSPSGADTAHPGDYIVRDQEGRFKVWPARKFEETFRRAGLRGAALVGEEGPELKR